MPTSTESLSVISTGKKWTTIDMPAAAAALSSSSEDSDSSWSEAETESAGIGSQLRAIAKSRAKTHKKDNKCEISCQKETMESANQPSSPSTSSCTSSPSSCSSKTSTGPFKLLQNHDQRQLQKLQALHESLDTITNDMNYIAVGRLVENALSQPENASLKRWVELQLRQYKLGTMSKARKRALRSVGIALRKMKHDKRKQEATPPKQEESTIPKSATLVVKQQDGTIDKYAVDPETTEAICSQVSLLKQEAYEAATKKRNREDLDDETPKKVKKSKKSNNDTPKKSNNSPNSFQSTPSEAAKLKRRRKRPPQKTPAKGDTIWVLYDQDDWWYRGQVVSKCNNSKVKVHWQDGNQIQAVDLALETWGIDNDPLANYNWAKEQKVDSCQIGTPLAVLWPQEGTDFSGTLTEIDLTKIEDGISVPHYIVYKDGDKEWTNLLHRKFTILEDEEED